MARARSTLGLYIPALFTVIVVTLFALLGDTIRILYPFQLITTGKAKLDILLRDSLEGSPFIAFFRTMSSHHWGVSALVLITSLAPALTVIVSGLYSPDIQSAYTQSVPLQLQDWFNLRNTTVESSTLGPEMALLMYGNLPYPTGLFDEYAFSLIESFEELTSASQESGIVEGRVPAVRAQLNCTLQGIYANMSLGGGGNPPAILFQPPQGCSPADNITGLTHLYLSDASTPQLGTRDISAFSYNPPTRPIKFHRLMRSVGMEKYISGSVLVSCQEITQTTVPRT